MLGIFLGVLIGMTVHEFAHNYVGHMMGDPVPAREGRLTLDPRVHIYMPGFLMFVLIGFGILGSAPIAAHRMRNPRWGYLAAVAAGPLSNLLVALVAAILFRLLGGSGFFLSLTLYYIILFNVLLFLFNFLPFFPLDGWFVVLSLLPSEQAYTWQRFAQISQYVFLGLILVSFMGLPFDLLGTLITGPMISITSFLTGF